MKNGKRSLIGLAMISAVAFGVSQAKATEIKIGMNGKEDIKSNSEVAWIFGFRDHIKNAGMTVKIFPSNSIGKEKERLDQVAQGLIEFDLATASTPFSMSPFMKGIFLPFLFKGSDEFDKVLANSNLLQRMNEKLIPNGVRLVGFTVRGMDAGLHNVKHPITKLSDMSDLRMRAMNKSQLEFYSALGASGTIVSWAEVANALQTGVAEGYMNAPNSSLRTGHSQYLKYFTYASVFPTVRAVLVSEDWYSSLSAADKKIIDAAIQAGIKANREWVENWSATVSKRFQEAGVTVSQLAPGEREKFEARARTTYADLVSADVLSAYKAAIAKAR